MSRGWDGGWEKSFNHWLHSLVAYNCLFVSQYNFLNLVDSFVYFWFVKYLEFIGIYFLFVCLQQKKKESLKKVSGNRAQTRTGLDRPRSDVAHTVIWWPGPHSPGGQARILVALHRSVNSNLVTMWEDVITCDVIIPIPVPTPSIARNSPPSPRQVNTAPHRLLPLQCYLRDRISVELHKVL